MWFLALLLWQKVLRSNIQVTHIFPFRKKKTTCKNYRVEPSRAIIDIFCSWLNNQFFDNLLWWTEKVIAQLSSVPVVVSLWCTTSIWILWLILSPLYMIHGFFNPLGICLCALSRSSVGICKGGWSHVCLAIPLAGAPFQLRGAWCGTNMSRVDTRI